MKVEFTILDNSNDIPKDDSNFLAFMESKSIEEPSYTTKTTRYIDTINDEDDELLKTYNELLSQYVKFEKTWKKGMESLE